MGVDFTGYSNIICMPIPYNYRATKVKRMLNNQNTLTSDTVSLLMCVYGISCDVKKNIYIPNEIILSEESEEWANKLYNNNMFSFIDWENDKYFFESIDTTFYSCDISYSKYHNFIEFIESLLCRELRYFIPSTDTGPDNGFIYNTNNLKILYEDLLLVKNKIANNKDYARFYNDFCKMLELAILSGGVKIS